MREEKQSQRPQRSQLEKRQAGLAQESHVRHFGGLKNLKGIDRLPLFKCLKYVTQIQTRQALKNIDNLKGL